MSSAVMRVSPSELAAWGQEDPDLELDQDGQIRPIPVPNATPARGSLASAAPVAIGAIASLARWD